jgi:hypothetical protein
LPWTTEDQPKDGAATITVEPSPRARASIDAPSGLFLTGGLLIAGSMAAIGVLGLVVVGLSVGLSVWPDEPPEVPVTDQPAPKPSAPEAAPEQVPPEPVPEPVVPVLAPEPVAPQPVARPEPVAPEPVVPEPDAPEPAPPAPQPAAPPELARFTFSGAATVELLSPVSGKRYRAGQGVPAGDYRAIVDGVDGGSTVRIPASGAVTLKCVAVMNVCR